MARKRSKAGGGQATFLKELYLGVPEAFETVPTWEKVLILAGTYKPDENHPGVRKQLD